MPGFGGNTVRAYLDSGTGASWRDWANVQGFHQGSWRQSTDVYVKDNDTWKKVWIRLTAPTTVTANFSAAGLSGTLTWSGAQGAEGYYIYRNGTLVQTVVGGNSSSATVSVPDYDTYYTFSVASYFGSTVSTQTSASSVRAIIPAPTLSVTSVTSYTYAGYDEWTGNYPVINLSWTAISGASSGYVIYKDGVQIATTASGATSYSYQSLSSDTNTQRQYTVKARTSSNISGASNTKTVNIGRPRTRVNSSSTYTGQAQEDYSGTTNGRWTVNYVGSAFGTYITSVTWTLTVPFGSAGNFVTASSVNRNCVLIQPGTDFNVPDDQREPYTRTVAYSGIQDGTWGVNPNGTGWSTDSNGNIRTFHVAVTLVIGVRSISQNEIAPQVVS